MKKLEVNTIKMFLREPVVEFNRPDGGRSIKTISLLDDEEKDLTKEDYKERYEILKKYKVFLQAQRERK